MKYAKKGLRLLSFSIILNIGWSVAYAILSGFVKEDMEGLIKFLSYGTLITAAVLVVCYIIDLCGLHIAGKGNHKFHQASFLKIASLVLAIVCLILGIVVATNPNAPAVIATIINVINIFTSVAEVVVLLCIISGCKEISPRVKGQANFVLVCFIIQVVAMIVLSFLAEKINLDDPEDKLIPAVAAISIVFSFAAILYAINYVILIFRTTANVGKPR
ncbi:MAG: hypothetical protein MJ207_04105 [Bacilli bacterium]|nr:hypothetical protein [Bacilli bacterium]